MRSIRTRSASEWLTSTAVTDPPERSIMEVSSLTAVFFAGASRRIVIEYCTDGNIDMLLVCHYWRDRPNF